MTLFGLFRVEKAISTAFSLALPRLNQISKCPVAPLEYAGLALRHVSAFPSWKCLTVKGKMRLLRDIMGLGEVTHNL